MTEKKVTGRTYRVSVICTTWTEQSGEEYQVTGQEVVTVDTSGRELPEPKTVDKRERVPVVKSDCSSATIFEQTVSELDVKAVVMAVNGGPEIKTDAQKTAEWLEKQRKRSES